MRSSIHAFMKARLMAMSSFGQSPCGPRVAVLAVAMASTVSMPTVTTPKTA